MRAQHGADKFHLDKLCFSIWINVLNYFQPGEIQWERFNEEYSDVHTPKVIIYSVSTRHQQKPYPLRDPNCEQV